MALIRVKTIHNQNTKSQKAVAAKETILEMKKGKETLKLGQKLARRS